MNGPQELEVVEVGHIRRFSDRALQGSIDRALANLGPDRKGAVVAHADRSGARLTVVGKVGDRWSVVGLLEKRFGGELKAEAAVRYAW